MLKTFVGPVITVLLGVGEALAGKTEALSLQEEAEREMGHAFREALGRHGLQVDKKLPPVGDIWRNLLLQGRGKIPATQLCDHFMEILGHASSLGVCDHLALFGCSADSLRGELQDMARHWGSYPAHQKTPEDLHALLRRSFVAEYNFELLLFLDSKYEAGRLLWDFLHLDVLEAHAPWALRTFCQFRLLAKGRHYRLAEVLAGIASVANNPQEREQSIRTLRFYGVRLEPPSYLSPTRSPATSLRWLVEQDLV